MKRPLPDCSLDRLGLSDCAAVPVEIHYLWLQDCYYIDTCFQTLYKASAVVLASQSLTLLDVLSCQTPLHAQKS